MGTASLACYALWALVVMAGISVWQRSRVGVAARVLGENYQAGRYLGLRSGRLFALGLVTSNAAVGLGGGLSAVYNGHASNLLGIGLVVKAFIALLIGDELARCFGVSKRAELRASVLGTLALVLLTIGTQQTLLLLRDTTPLLCAVLRDTDKQIVLAAALAVVLRARTGSHGVDASAIDY
jgi:ABC-type uncharacterized transport system permease subunit